MPATTTYGPTGDQYVNGVLSGIKWAVNSFTFSFPTSGSFYGSSYGNGEHLNNFGAFNSVQQSATRDILKMYAGVANLTFTEVAESASVHGDLRYAKSDAPYTAWAYYPTTNAAGGDSWYNNSKGWYDNPLKGTYAWTTILHETGHALGLKHPHEASGSFGALPVDKDSLEYTVMSYRSFIGASTTSGYTNGSTSYPQTLMMYDIAAIQTLYGANYSTNAGNTVYSWSPTTGEMFINGVGQGAPAGNKIFMTIWDGGGNDTYDFSNYATNLKIDLGPGGWTTTSSTQLAALGSGKVAAGNIANALLFNNNQASLIENAIGGSGNDIIVGNAANNRLTGGRGNDIIDGGAGIDTAVYSGARSDYSWLLNGDDSWTIVDLRSGSPDGTDTLRSIEYLQFSDELVALVDSSPDVFVLSNSAPVAAMDSYATAKNVQLVVGASQGVLANDRDANGDLLKAVLVKGPAKGQLTLNQDGSFIYTPAKNATGKVTFTYKATDGVDSSATTTVTITIAKNASAANAAKVNNMILVAPDNYAAVKATPLIVDAANGVLANDIAINGGEMKASLVNGSKAGKVALAADGSFTFAPSKNYTGTTSFTYKVTDGAGFSHVATATIKVSAPPKGKGHHDGHHDIGDDQIPAPALLAEKSLLPFLLLIAQSGSPVLQSAIKDVGFWSDDVAAALAKLNGIQEAEMQPVFGDVLDQAAFSDPLAAIWSEFPLLA